MDDIPMPEPPRRLTELFEQAASRQSSMASAQARLTSLKPAPAPVAEDKPAVGGLYAVLLNPFKYLDTADATRCLASLEGVVQVCLFGDDATGHMWFVRADKEHSYRATFLRDALRQRLGRVADIVVVLLDEDVFAVCLRRCMKPVADILPSVDCH